MNHKLVISYSGNQKFYEFNYMDYLEDNTLADGIYCTCDEGLN